ncbi:MAG: TIGR04282 family arsenosugar biosynthesis glycosyltransferase [Caulobacterales bacterium]|nr:TIGR04282 family arsenosugar biosynthesis glycosyltransferase [Caulobacterales bacterium]
MSDRRLAIFARLPRLSHGKTRLAAELGPAQALRIARAMSARVITGTRDPRWESALIVTPDQAVTAPAPGLWPPDLSRLAQGRGDLGARLERALDRRGATVVIGADAPDVTGADIWDAFRALRRRDLVLGPARDGGFWLMGVKAPLRRGALAGVRWSSAHTLADTRQALAELGEPALLRELADVDDAKDWRERGGRI